jgi:hypothetical protein
MKFRKYIRFNDNNKKKNPVNGNGEDGLMGLLIIIIIILIM